MDDQACKLEPMTAEQMVVIEDNATQNQIIVRIDQNLQILNQMLDGHYKKLIDRFCDHADAVENLLGDIVESKKNGG